VRKLLGGIEQPPEIVSGIDDFAFLMADQGGDLGEAIQVKLEILGIVGIGI
jgi:hypothetical protein